jgi:hypothetical protein
VCTRVGCDGEDVFVLALDNACDRNDIPGCGLFEQ